jgi:hypothetical protein
MKIIPCSQGSSEWLISRSGIPTASEFDSLVTPRFEPRKGQTPESYLATKLAERWLGGPLPAVGSWGDMEQGKIREEDARPWYELEYSVAVKTVGFVTTDDGKVGCSPDGLIGEDGGLEIKCPAPHTHVKYLLANEVPDEYLAQVHGSMFVTGRPWWRFMSFRPKFPALVIQVNRDEAIQERLAEVLGLFTDKLDRAFERLCEINGSLPKHMLAPKSDEKPWWWGAGEPNQEEAA